MIDNQISLSYKSDPETILMEHERKKLLKEVWEEIKSRIEPFDYAILMEYVSCNNNFLTTGDKLKLHPEVISRSIYKIQQLTKQIAKEKHMTLSELRENIKPQINDFFTQKASNVGYPSEAYMNLPARRSWTVKFGTKRFTENKRCLIPEFLEASECKCNCNICIEGYKCTRIDAYPENAEPKEYLAKKEKQLREIIKEIQSEMTEADWQLEKVVNI